MGAHGTAARTQVSVVWEAVRGVPEVRSWVPVLRAQLSAGGEARSVAPGGAQVPEEP